MGTHAGMLAPFLWNFGCTQHQILRLHKEAFLPFSLLMGVKKLLRQIFFLI